MQRVKLTKRVIDAFACPTDLARAAMFDSEILGFHVEAYPNGRKVYRLKWKRNGQQGRETLGEHGVITVDQARARAISLKGKIQDGLTPATVRASQQAERQRGMPLSVLIERWLAEGGAAAPMKRASSWEADARKLRLHIVPLLGKKEISQVTRADIEDAQLQIAQGATARDIRTKSRGRSIVKGGAGIARSAVMSLSACFSWAVDREIVAENPCLKVKKTKPRKLERFLSEEEAARLYKTLDAMELGGRIDRAYADIIRLLMLTGARKSEIKDLQWREIDGNRRLIRLSRERSKTGEKIIPLNDASIDILQRRKSALGENVDFYVFPSKLGDGPVQNLQKVWSRVRGEADLFDVRLHDLRHSFASFAAADGASLFLIGKALGHTQSQTTERYAHLRDDPLHEVAASVQNRILSGK
jgi:integrase